MRKSPDISIINIDCIEFLKSQDDNSFDLAIVDPPYGIDAPNMSMGSNSKKNKANSSESVSKRLKKARFSKGSGKLKNRALNTMRLDWDVKPTKEYFDQLFRVSKNQIIFGGNYFDLPPTRCVICWDKVQPWENFSQWEMAWTSFDKVASLYRCSNKGGNTTELKIHPTQKPVKLYKWLLDKYAEPGFKILDTHLGSGTIALACHDLGYDLVGCEIDKEYYQSALKQFNKHKSQLMLF